MTTRKIIQNVWILVMDLRKYLITHRVDYTKYLDKFIEKLEFQINKLSNLSTFDRAILDIEAPKLFKIHDTLVGKFAKLYIGNTSLMRGVHDRFFAVFGIKVPRRRFGRLPTQLASEFCKGITYFVNNAGIDAIPFYHRENSCGSLNRVNLLNPVFLKNCYLERLVYDQIYMFVFHEQNIEHLHELQTIERMYQDAYPKEQITVNVYFLDELYPNKLVIRTDYFDGSYPCIETYIKSNEHDFINCSKFHGEIKHEKSQTFLQESPWILQK